MRGFTLLELILYVAIVTIVVSAMIPFAWNVIEGGTKSTTEQEVFSNARLVSERIKYEIRNASGINSVTGTSISLVTLNAGTNPTIIDLSSGKIRIKQGSGATTNLNSDDTTISCAGVTPTCFLNFTSGDNKTKNIQFVFTLQSNFSQTRQEYQQTINLQGSAEVRSN